MYSTLTILTQLPLFGIIVNDIFWIMLKPD